MRSARTVICSECGNTFKTNANNQKRCYDCIPKYEKKYRKNYTQEKRVSGIGSGNAQGFGKDHHSFKYGIGIFRRIKLESMSIHQCEKCGKDLTAIIKDKVKGRYLWCVHHIDRNRHNNNLDNLQLLCKRCHQLEHNCTDNLKNNVSKV